MPEITLSDYLKCDSTNVRLQRIASILDSIEQAMIDGTIDLGQNGYSFEDGQMKVSTNFRSLDDLQKAHIYWTKVFNMLAARCSGVGYVYTLRQAREVGR